MAFKAAIRAGALKTIGTGRGGIASAESHAKRLDPVAQSRVVQERDPIAWSKAESGALDDIARHKAGEGRALQPPRAAILAAPGKRFCLQKLCLLHAPFEKMCLCPLLGPSDNLAEGQIV